MSTEDHKQALPGGFRLGSYRVVRVLGAGGFGVTYLCEHAGLGVQVAVKEYLPNEIAVRDGTAVHPKSAGDREGFEWGLSRFLDEARTLARFEHPNVVRVRDCFEANNTAYIVMDYEDGEPLDRLLQRLGTLTEAQLTRVVLPVADGLRHVHAAGFLHRDIKPSNIFVRRSDESPVMLDFGSARQALGRRSMSVTAIASAGYSPPEQYEKDGAQGAWTDIYALSALCYRAITGDAPTEAPRRQGQLLRTQVDPLPRLAESVAPGYSPAFLEAVNLGLRVIETERPQDVDDWLERMQATIPTPASQGLATSHATSSPRSPGVGEAPSQRPRTPGASERPSGSVVRAGEAVSGLKTLAEQGDADAQYKLGRASYFGEDGPKETGQAVLWFRKAAEQGHAQAQYRLGFQHLRGEGVPKDAREAALWFRKAAEQGHSSAALQLKRNTHYRPDRKAPAHGHASNTAGRQADRLEGIMRLLVGVLVIAIGIAVAHVVVGAIGQNQVRQDARPRSVAPAVRPPSMRAMAERGDARSQWRLGYRYYSGDGVPKDARQAALWYRKAAEQGLAEAQDDLGVLYDNGEGVPKDDREAARWFRRAADQGFASAQHNLAYMYANGQGVPEDDGEAIRWYRKAAEQGLERAQYNLGLAYDNGEGAPEDDSEAVRWYRKTAEQGYAAAQNNLGYMYANGQGVPEHDGEAALWYRKAAKQGNAAAQTNLGYAYYNGEGVPTDYVQAYAWLNLAAAQGRENAVRLRASLRRDMPPSQVAEAQNLSRELVD